MANIYLIPTLDSTYRAHIAEYAPVRDAVFLTAEGSYPANLWYVRHDPNAGSLLSKVSIRNRDALLANLNFLGEYRDHVAELWSYGVKDTPNDAANRLFKKCQSRKVVLAKEAMLQV